MIRHHVFNNTVFYLVLSLMALVSVFPLFFGIASSFRIDEEIYKYAIPFSLKTIIPQNITLVNYITLFRDYNFIRPIMNTVTVVLVTIFFSCFVNGIAAFAFATFDFKFKKIIYAVVLLSFMIPFESIAMPLYIVVNRLGWIDTLYGIIVPCVADGLVLFLFTQFFRDIPPSLIEAARVDGASWATVFLKIIIPSSVPVFITAGLMVFMNQWNAYLWPLLVARSRSIRLIQIALSDFRTEHWTLWGCIYAGTVISAAIPLLLFLPFQKYFVQGIISSGIKG